MELLCTFFIFIKIHCIWWACNFENKLDSTNIFVNFSRNLQESWRKYDKVEHHSMNTFYLSTKPSQNLNFDKELQLSKTGSRQLVGERIATLFNRESSRELERQKKKEVKYHEEEESQWKSVLWENREQKKKLTRASREKLRRRSSE